MPLSCLLLLAAFNLSIESAVHLYVCLCRSALVIFLLFLFYKSQTAWQHITSQTDCGGTAEILWHSYEHPSAIKNHGWSGGYILLFLLLLMICSSIGVCFFSPCIPYINHWLLFVGYTCDCSFISIKTAECDLRFNLWFCHARWTEDCIAGTACGVRRNHSTGTGQVEATVAVVYSSLSRNRNSWL